jgi:hypothetical protein
MARRNRLLTASLVASFLLATRALWPNPQVRAEHQYLLVITLGYGHLIGAAVFSHRRLRNLVPTGVSPRLFWAFVATTVADLFALYAWLSNVSILFFLPLLAVSLWHIVENDLALGRSDGEGLALGALLRRLDARLAALGATALLLALGQSLLGPGEMGPALAGSAVARFGNAPARIGAAVCGVALAGMGRRRSTGIALAGASLCLPGGAARGLSFGDFFSAVTLYHLIQFLVLFADRARAMADPAARRRLATRLAWVHLPPAILCIALVLEPDGRLATLRYAVFSPAIYLFWSVLHVGQTLAVRGLEPGAARAPDAIGT